MNTSSIEESYEIEKNYWWFRARWRIVKQMLDRYGPGDEDMNIIDMGCGPGYHVEYLSNWFKNIRGFDCSDEAVEFGRKRGLNIIKGRLPDDMNIEKQSMNVVLMMDVLEHVEQDRASAEKALDILRPGGIIIATVPAFQFLKTKRDDFYGHKRRYSKKQFSELFQGLPAEIKYFGYFNFFLFLPIALSRIASRLFGYDKSSPDINQPPNLLNKCLEELFALERFLLGRIHFPIGVSLIGVFQKDN